MQSKEQEVTLSWRTRKRAAKNVDLAPNEVNSIRK